MSDTNIAPAGDDGAPAPEVVSIPASEAKDVYSATEAANAIADYRYKRDAKESTDDAPKPAGAARAAEAPELVEETDAAPPEEAPGDKTEAAEPEEELPTIEPPRSWTKEEKEEFKSYPRQAQEIIARREQDRETSLRKGQNENAEQRKAFEAERVKVEQARQQYESALPALLQALQEQQQGEFADIKTMADVDKLAREDWPRYALWDAQQKKVAAVTQEVKAAQERQQSEYKTKWSEFAKTEDAKFLERAPEMADREKATKIADASIALLEDIGFTQEELAKAWNGEVSVSLRDHRIQLLIRDGVKYREAQAVGKKVAPKPVPTVQRPGVRPAKNEQADARVTALEKQLSESGSWKDAADLIAARRAG